MRNFKLWLCFSLSYWFHLWSDSRWLRLLTVKKKKIITSFASSSVFGSLKKFACFNCREEFLFFFFSSLSVAAEVEAVRVIMLIGIFRRPLCVSQKRLMKYGGALLFVFLSGCHRGRMLLTGSRRSR